MADFIISSSVGNKIIVFTKGDSIISNDTSIVNCNDINCCTSEEADPRLVRHTIHCVDRGYQNVVVHTGDTDVLILLISFRPMTKMYSNMYAYFMTAGSLRIYDVNALCLNIGIPFCGAIPFFYTFTGCDTVSSFFNVGKCKFYDALSTFTKVDLLTEVFKVLGQEPN